MLVEDAKDNRKPALKDGQSQRVMPVENTMDAKNTYRSLDKGLIVHFNGEG